MQLKEFKYQQKQRKQQLLCEKGVYLAQRSENEFTVLLFQVASFYVEVYIDEEEEMISYIKAFNSTDKLGPYLQAIDVSGLFR